MSDIINFLIEKNKYIKQKAFETVINAGRGHLGGSFSVAEVLTALYYGNILNVDPKDPKKEDRDFFIMSKGHAINTLHVVLADLGFFDISELDKYTKNGSILGGHTDHVVPGIEILGGSLGHGLGVAAGMALGLKLDKKKNKVVVVIGDGESQEGSIWEALMFAAHHKLSNLYIILDRNQLGSEDKTENTCSLEPLRDKIDAFGLKVREFDGHEMEEVYNELLTIKNNGYKNCPTLFISNTLKGKGLAGIENTPKAHHTLPKGNFIEETRSNLKNGL